MMELGIAADEFTTDSSYIAKGKRTKRPRPLSPCTVVAAITSSSSSASAAANDYNSFSSATDSSQEEEEQDMANCLILLAQGKGGEDDNQKSMREKGSSSSSSNNRKFSDVAPTVTAPAKNGFYIYECKTCNRTFPSFQALGGHRASHKRPKVTPEEKKPPQPQPQPQSQIPIQLIANCEFKEAKTARVVTSPPISLQLACGAPGNSNNKPSKVHECSICGSEFASGQALGGHMRRHRASTGAAASGCDAAAAAVEVKPPRKVLELDLNLPAPEEDHLRDFDKFQFTAATQKSALVGCHY